MNVNLKGRGFLAALLLALSVQVSAMPLHFEGFEDPAWVPGAADNWNNFGGTIARVASGTDGITSSDGTAHAVLSGSAFTRLGGYNSSFDGGFSTGLDVYLDPNWSEGSGFDYSVAVNNQAGNHRRDFIFHVGVVGGALLVNASNNADFATNPFKLQNENGGNNIALNLAGWYTLQHVFRDDGGVLAVDFNLLDSSGSSLYSVTRSNPSDDIATIVGGNRYGWFTHNDINRLALDNTIREGAAAVPEPASVLLLGLALVTAAGSLRRRTLLVRH